MTIQDSCNLDALIEGYIQYQRRTRGLREPTLYTYERFIRLFIRRHTIARRVGRFLERQGLVERDAEQRGYD